MIFKEINRQLKPSQDESFTFKILDLEPVEKAFHFIDLKASPNETPQFSKIECTDKTTCEYCIAARTLFKMNDYTMQQRAMKLYAKKRYYWPILLEKNNHGLENGEYFYEFGRIVKDAYNQLILNYDVYKFNTKHALSFTHKTIQKHGYPCYDTCSFSFGKKNLTIEKLIRDASSDSFAAFAR